MLAPIAFIGGVISLLIGETGQTVQRTNYWKQYYEDKAAGYDEYTQSSYSARRSELWQECDIMAMAELVQKDRFCSECLSYTIAEAAACKYLMESETNYKYKQSGVTEGLDLTKYVIVKKKYRF